MVLHCKFKISTLFTLFKTKVKLESDQSKKQFNVKKVVLGCKVEKASKDKIENAKTKARVCKNYLMLISAGWMIEYYQNKVFSY